MKSNSLLTLNCANIIYVTLTLLEALSIINFEFRYPCMIRLLYLILPITFNQRIPHDRRNL